MNEKHKCCIRERERGSKRERSAEHRESVVQTRFCLGFGSASKNNNSYACFYFGELYNTALHSHTVSIARQRAGKSSQPKLVALVIVRSRSLSRMHCTHCVKLAPLIVVAVHFNALFRTLFPSLCLPSLFAFASLQQPLQFE